MMILFVSVLFASEASHRKQNETTKDVYENEIMSQWK